MTLPPVFHLPPGSPAWVLTAALILHIGAGSMGIITGYVAVIVRKGERLHRAFGTLFFLSMLIVSTLAVLLALFAPTLPGGAPPNATVPVGILAFYFVATGWMTVRRKERGVGAFDYVAFLIVLGVAAAMLIFGVRSESIPLERFQGFPTRYYVFASFAAFSAALDLKVMLRGGISGAARIARHLWRMCFAFFFAAVFFFIAQQKIMPAFMHGSPVLLALGLAPLAFLFFWLFRVRLTGWFKPPAVTPEALVGHRA